MTGSPFSNVLASDPASTYDSGSGNFVDVEAGGGTDTTSESNVAPVDSGTESSLGVEVSGTTTKVAGENETHGDEDPGTPTP
jgi:hypothetical protein